MSKKPLFIAFVVTGLIAAVLPGIALAQETLSSVQREMDRVEKEIEREKELHRMERKRATDFETEKAAKLRALQDQIRLTQGRIDSLKGQFSRARGQKATYKSQAALYQGRQKDFSKALSKAVRDQAVALNKDFPYQVQKRVLDLEELANGLDNGVVTVEDGVGRLFTLLQASLDFASDTEVYRGTYQATDGSSLEGNYVRMGAALLAFASEDGQHAAWLSRTDGGYAWVDKELPAEVKQEIVSAVSVAQGKTAPRLVNLPFSAPRARQAGASASSASSDKEAAK